MSREEQHSEEQDEATFASWPGCETVFISLGLSGKIEAKSYFAASDRKYLPFSSREEATEEKKVDVSERSHKKLCRGWMICEILLRPGNERSCR